MSNKFFSVEKKSDNFIEKYCPNGVEYKRIADIANVLRGKRLTKSDLVEGGAYPVYHGGLEPLGFYRKKNRDAFTTMIINVGASAGTVGFCEDDFWSSDGCYCISHSEYVLPKFVYYALACREPYLMSKVRKAGIPTLDAKIVEDIKIPIPPLPVQQEIVRILDNYSTAVSELKATLSVELTARRKQYEHYRDELLTFSANEDVRQMSMGDIYDFQYGKGNKIPAGTGKYPVYGSNGIVGSYDEYNSEDSPVIGHIGAYAGIVNWGAGKHFVTYNGVICKLKNPDVLAKYGYYLLLLQNYLEKAKDGSQPFVSYDILKQPVVSVPSLKKQREITDILDRFDTLCNDLTSGLPAEIEARQKQYEYYRDKLLNFKELEA